MKTNRICIICTSHTAYRENLGKYFISINPNVHFVDRTQLGFLDSLTVYPNQLQGRVSSYTSVQHDEVWHDAQTNTPLKANFDSDYTEDVILHEASCGGIPIEIFHHIRLQNFVKQLIQDRLSSLPSEFIGVHIRHMDYKNSNIDDFFSFIENDILDIPYFLASDNIEIADYCKQRYPKGIQFAVPLQTRQNDTNLHISTSEWMTSEQIAQRNLDAILDLFTLANASKILASFPNSGYSRFASFLRKHVSLVKILCTLDSELESAKKSIEYDTIQSFPLKDSKYLFFDGFRTHDGEIILICPQYMQDSGYLDKIQLIYKGLYLRPKEFKLEPATRTMDMPCISIHFEFPFQDNCAEILVVFEQRHKLLHLYPPSNPKNKYLFLQSSFIQHDKRMFPLFYKYYTQFGEPHHILYYNGKFDAHIQTYFKQFANVKLLEWKFQHTHEFFESDTTAHAEPGYRLHFLHKYAKQMATYFSMLNLDQYIYMYDLSLQSILDRKQFDCIFFESYDADTIESTFVKEFPQTFYIGNKYEYPTNVVSICKSSIAESVSSKSFPKFAKQPYICPVYFKVFQFYRWSGTYKILTNPTLYSCTSYNEINITQFLKKFKDIRFLYIPTKGSSSDCVGAKGFLDIVQQLNLHVELGSIEETYSQRFLVYAGGCPFLDSTTQIKESIQRNLTQQNVIILLPQTIQDIDDLIPKFNQNVFLMCRDKKSYDYARERCFFKENVLLSHDLSFSITDIDSFKHSGNGDLYAFQPQYPPSKMIIPINNVDICSVYLKPMNTSTPKLIIDAYTFVMNIVSDYETIYTNRLHVAIVAARLGKRVHFYSSFSTKNKDIYEYSLKDKYPNVKFIE